MKKWAGATIVHELHLLST